ncbi:MAG TPA: dihydrofolate reductase family protein [Candidatus Limnocylindria bacterium]|nr:dihydrofolate reductase family protein [Candidatus Limnocylindria bacterium]
MTAIAIREAPAAAALTPLVEAPRPAAPARGGVLPQLLRGEYGGDLAIGLRPDRPTLVTNFVSTLDGVVSYATPEAAGGGEISGFYEPDRFVMGLLRSLADVVLIGAGTLRAGSQEAWTPRFIHPHSSGEFAALRRSLNLRPEPITAVVSGSGSLDLRHPGLADPAVEVVVITTRLGAAHLRDQAVPAHVTVLGVGSEGVEPRALLDLQADRGARLVLCEGGPQLFGQLLAADLVDELFLTLAPQLAGRSSETPRLSLVEQRAFTVAGAPWGELLSLRRAADHLFARYRIRHDGETSS